MIHPDDNGAVTDGHGVAQHGRKDHRPIAPGLRVALAHLFLSLVSTDSE